MTACEYERMAVWLHDECMIVEMHECMYGKRGGLFKLGYLPRGLGAYEGEHHICERNEHHHRPEPGAGKRHRHRSSERSAHACR